MEMRARRTRKETENKNGVIARRGLRVSLLGGWMDGWMMGLRCSLRCWDVATILRLDSRSCPDSIL
jgi:hypothetical protein